MTVLSKCEGQYAYFGLESGIAQILSKYPPVAESLTSIDVVINIDGLPLFKSSNYQFWPILGKFNNLDVFLIALVYGKTKPNSVEEYLHAFLEELDRLKATGIVHETKSYNIHLKSFCCDAPARGFLKCTIGHTGYFSCERCIVEGHGKVGLSVTLIRILLCALINSLLSLCIKSIKNSLHH